MIIRTCEGFVIGRDPVVTKGRQNQPAIATVKLEAGQTLIWDGRFLIKGLRGHKHVQTVYQAIRNDGLDLEKEFRRDLRSLPGVFRGSMPAMFDPESGQLPASIGCHPHPDVRVEPLVAPRLQAMLMCDILGDNRDGM